MLRGWQRRSNPIHTHIWNKNIIKRILHEREQDFRLTLARFFPKSYGITNHASDLVIESLIELLNATELDEAIPHVVTITESESDTLVRWRLAESILERTPSLEDCYDLLKIWVKDNRQNFQTALNSSLVDYFGNQMDYLNEIGEELHPNVPVPPGYQIGMVSAEISDVELDADDKDTVLLKCSGTVNAEIIDTFDHDSTSMSLLAVSSDFFVLMTGLRKNEAALLKWNDVHLKRGYFEIVDTKNNLEFALPITSILSEIFSRRAKTKNSNNPYVFAAAGKNGYFDLREKHFELISKKTKTPFSLHDLRRTYLTQGFLAGHDLEMLKNLANHKNSDSDDVTKGYLIVKVADIKEPMTKVQERILQLMNRKTKRTLDDVAS